MPAPLEYSRPEPRQRPPTFWRQDVPVGLCLAVALLSAYMTAVHRAKQGHGQPTAQYRDYLYTYGDGTRPPADGTAPPFVGAKIRYYSVWNFRTSYVCLAAATAAAAIFIGNALYWRGRPEHPPQD